MTRAACLIRSIAKAKAAEKAARQFWIIVL